MKTQIVIVGGGPAGLLLSHFLHLGGIESVVLERSSREHVESRIRAGVLEQGTADMLREAGLSARMDAECLTHTGFSIAFDGKMTRVDLPMHTGGKRVFIYGQTEITRDLYAARNAAGGVVIDCANNVALHNLEESTPYATWQRDDMEQRCECDFIAGCDGFHGVSRRSIPTAQRREFTRQYQFGWLGILSPTPPVHEELIYARHERGFALCSMRSPTLSRYYIQCAAGEEPEKWTDEQFWEELKRRLPPEIADGIETGASVEKSVAPLRSFVAEPMRWKKLFLAGDAAHIVPPTGAKGLNLAAADARLLAEAFIAYYHDNDDSKLNIYSEKALARAWRTEYFSWYMTSLLHNFPEDDSFSRRLRDAGLRMLCNSESARAFVAENYAGLPF